MADHTGGTQDASNSKRLMLTRFVTFVLPALVIAGSVATVFILDALRDEPEEKDTLVRSLSVLVSEVQVSTVQAQVVSQGEVRPRADIALTSEVGGRVEALSPEFIEGGQFQDGDVILRLEDEDYQLALTRARAEVAQARSNLQREQAQAEIARREWEELGDGAAPTPLTLREPQLAQAQAAINAALAAEREAALNLARTTVAAPFNGRVSEKTVDLGQFVTPGQRLGQIFSTDLMEVRLPLSDAELARLGLPVGFRATAQQPGPRVMLSAVVAGQERRWEGRITRTSPRFDPTTRLLFAITEVEDLIDETGEMLAPGLFVDAVMDGRIYENVVELPRAALRGADTVYVVTPEETLAFRSVRIVARERDSILVSGGLALGERVITSPVRGAADGMSVTTVDTSATADAPPTTAQRQDETGEELSAAQEG